MAKIESEITTVMINPENGHTEAFCDGVEIPLQHSDDMVNWTLYDKSEPLKRYVKPMLMFVANDPLNINTNAKEEK